MFSYKDLMNEIAMFEKHGCEVGVIGQSEENRDIPYVFVGNKNGNNMIVQGAIHAREHLTALLVVNLAKFLLREPTLKMLGGIYFVPMVNPDGVMLCQEGLSAVKNKTKKKQLVEINGGTNFSLWKANIDGVDLNVNFDAKWGEGTSNVFCRASESYVGISPVCARETKALVDFTLEKAPVVTLSYHLKGEQIYWQFGQVKTLARDKSYAEAISRYTGYQLVDDGGSTGGYKDWCISSLGIPSFTIEVGNDKYSHPFPYSEFATVYRQNEDVPRRLLNSVVRDNANEVRSVACTT